MIDLDLDLVNLVKKFPENDEDCIIIIRNDVERGFLISRGTLESLSNAFYNIMYEHNELRDIVFNATLSYLNANPKEINKFVSFIKK